MRSTAKGVINLLGGVGALLATFGGAALYTLNGAAPFWAGSILMVISALVVFAAIKEPQVSAIGTDKEERWWQTVREIGDIRGEARGA